MEGSDRRDNGQKQQNTRDEREEQPPRGCVFELFLMGVRLV